MTDFSKLTDKELDLMFKLNLDKKKEAYELLRKFSSIKDEEINNNENEENLDNKEDESSDDVEEKTEE